MQYWAIGEKSVTIKGQVGLKSPREAHKKNFHYCNEEHTGKSCTLLIAITCVNRVIDKIESDDKQQVKFFAYVCLIV